MDSDEDVDSTLEADVGEAQTHRRTYSSLSDEEIVKHWAQLPYNQKKELNLKIQIDAIWSHVLLQPAKNHRVTEWAIRMGFLSKDLDAEMSVVRLHRIQILEYILDALNMTCMVEAKLLPLVYLLKSKHRHFVHQALDWICMVTGPRAPEFIMHIKMLETEAASVLDFVFTEYFNVLKETTLKLKNNEEVRLLPCPYVMHKSEQMKSRGNELFQKGEYMAALEYYNKAIMVFPNNYKLYGNRALCYLRCEQYLKAAWDGKRVIVIRPEWAKGHYRFCLALFHLEQGRKALEANERALLMCLEDSEGYEDLKLQNNVFRKEHFTGGCPGHGRYRKPKPKIPVSKRMTPQVNLMSAERKNNPSSVRLEQQNKSCTSEDKESDPVASEELSDKSRAGTQQEKHPACQGKRDLEPSHLEMSEKKTQKLDLRKMKNKQAKETEKETIALKDQLKWAVQDAYTALADQRSRNAVLAFTKALGILDGSAAKELDVSEIDKTILFYGHATALLEVGQPEELAEAEKQFEKMKETAERQFQSVVYFGNGKVLLKENRFSKALDQFKDALQMVNLKIVPGKLTWPTTSIAIAETQTDHLKTLLENYIEMCKFPPKPDAICRQQICVGHSKNEIYFTDPDFKGFIRLICCQNCNVEFHVSCWKKLKSALYNDKVEKDFLRGMCFTPDCCGKICHIVIFGATGLIKCEFESSVAKTNVSPRLKANQKCTSVKKLNLKNERKLKRKQHKQTMLKQRQAENKLEEEIVQPDTEQKQKTTAAWLDYGDRILHQISVNKELIKDQAMDIGVCLGNLQPWMELDVEKGRKRLKDPETLAEVVELLLERKSRVWARVFVAYLSSSEVLCTKLHNWARQLDNAGLNAANAFIERYAEPLEELDLNPLLTFAPLQEALIQKFGTMPDFSTGFTIIEYLNQAPTPEKRLFIWTLEENRDKFDSLHYALNEYFEVMDHCLVVKKADTDDQTSNSKCKNKKWKKKQNRSVKQPFMNVSGARRGASTEDDDFYDRDSLFFLDPDEPFQIPDYLQDRVSQFEEQLPSDLYNNFFDNGIKMDHTKDSLYHYFAEILEKHGPLLIDDELLVGELENFPIEAQLKIEKAGGLKWFLLESPRFTMNEDYIELQEDKEKHLIVLPSFSYLNPSAREFTPKIQPTTSNVVKESSLDTTHQDCFPYTFSDNDIFTSFDIVDLTSIHNLDGFADDPEEVVSGSFDMLDGSETNDMLTIEGTFSQHHLKDDQQGRRNPFLLQSCSGSKRGVAVNTEPYEPFEKDKGDMLKRERDVFELEKNITRMEMDYVDEQQKRKGRISVLEVELKEVNQSIEISKKELELFQQKLEEEVNKDQQEKRENQETIKALKAEIKELTDVKECLSKNVMKKNKEYETQFTLFLDNSNQSAAEKMSLEEEIKRLRNLCAAATLRSRTAEMSMLENRRIISVRPLNKYVTEGEWIFAKLKDIMARFPQDAIQQDMDTLQMCVQDAKDKILRAEKEYKDQMELLKKGTKLQSLPVVFVPDPKHHPTLQSLTVPHQLLHPAPYGGPVPQFNHRGPKVTPVPVGAFPVGAQPFRMPRAAALSNTQPMFPTPAGVRGAAPKQLNTFEKIIDRLTSMFPHYSRPVLSSFIQEVRSASGGCLNSLSYDDVISRVAQLILDHQENSREYMHSPRSIDSLSTARQTPSPRSDSPASGRSSATPPPSQAWKSMGTQLRPKAKAFNMKDPCVICHEEITELDLCILECRHSFHQKCIRSWLKEQSTCPTCREHALLPEDFPKLHGRRRRGVVNADSST